MKNCLVRVLVFLSLMGATPAIAKEPGWSGTVIARGAQREAIEATPILQRPYRPMHFYGNTVRREYYRGERRATVGDVARGTAAFVLRW